MAQILGVHHIHVFKGEKSLQFFFKHSSPVAYFLSTQYLFLKGQILPWSSGTTKIYLKLPTVKNYLKLKAMTYRNS